MPAAQAQAKNSVTIVLFSGDLDKAIAAFVIATAAASMGMKVNIFFTFWGLNAIKKKGGLIKGQNWMQRMLNIVNYGHARKLALSKLNMMGMGPVMLKAMMSKKRVPSLEEFIKTASAMGVKFYPCEMSMTVMGLRKEDFIDECRDVIGAVSYLSIARDSDVNLFI
ncbi:MAG: DsrE/DsrF/DrsH-like family protein [Deltaproteobacteria bacterium]|nr:DsrE/DsrF/DrsH-like family protein [Deltaproteobacteria bacterium]MBZ0220113.1 DsrE/DsrF/DrsH-like family protein [Deltaproteobacteria bacterium]